MSKQKKLAAADPKPNAPQKGFRQSSSRVGGGAAFSSLRQHGTALPADLRRGPGTSLPTRADVSSATQASARNTERRGLGSPEKAPPIPPAIQAEPDEAFPGLNDRLSSLVEQTSLSEEQFNGLYDDKDAHRISGYRSDPVIAVKHLTPAELFSLSAFIDPARVSLGGFRNRYNSPNQQWMRGQHYYLETAVLAAAHDCLIPLFEVDVGLGRTSVDGYDAIRFLKCGRPVDTTEHGRVFFDCGDVCRCPACNKKMRVLPVKAEFLPAFGHEKAPFWYRLELSVTNNPETAGVHLEVGRDENGDPIFEDLFLLNEVGTYHRLDRFGTDAVDHVMTVVHSVFDFAHWLRRKGIFGGMGLVGDIKFNFFPDPSREFGCNHSILPHAHAIGNTPQLLGRDVAEVMFHQFLKMLIKEGGGRLAAYPDIYLKPCATVEELETAINYVVKPFKLAKSYIEGLSRGCPVVGLNIEFHQNVWTCESMFQGSCKHLVTLGNMHVNAGENYIGNRQYRTMTKKQLKEFFEKLELGEASRRDIQRYEEHQKAKEQQRIRRLEWERERQALNFERPVPVPGAGKPTTTN